MMLAVANGHIDAVILLLEKGANINAADKQGCTALHRGVSHPFKTYKQTIGFEITHLKPYQI